MTINYREVERTVEFDPIDGWVYRVVDTEYGVLVKRTAEVGRPMWSHSILTQIYQPNANEFVPACRADNPWLQNFAEGLAVVERQGMSKS